MTQKDSFIRWRIWRTETFGEQRNGANQHTFDKIILTRNKTKGSCHFHFASFHHIFHIWFFGDKVFKRIGLMGKEAILFTHVAAALRMAAPRAWRGAGRGRGTLARGDTGWDRGGGAPSSPISFMGHWCGGGRGRGGAAWDGVTIAGCLVTVWPGWCCTAHWPRLSSTLASVPS